jgi:hypothetical protein
MQNSLSWQFELAQILLSVLFWILGWIPVLNLVTNAIWLMILTAIFIYKYLPLIGKIRRSGVNLLKIGLKISLINIICGCLGFIPIVCWIPWQTLSVKLTNNLLKKAEREANELQKNVGQLKGAYNKEVRQQMQKRIMSQRAANSRAFALAGGTYVTTNRSLVNNSSSRPVPINTRTTGTVIRTVGSTTKTAGTITKTVGQTTKYTGKATKVAGKSVEIGGKGVEVAGKGVAMGGSALVRSGIGMSETLIGALAGVPLAVTGAAVYTAGKTVQAGGKIMEETGKVVEVAGKVAEKTGSITATVGEKMKGVGTTSQNIGENIQKGNAPTATTPE